MIDALKVIEIHDLILRDEPGLQGSHGVGPLEGALARIDAKIHYDGLDDIFDIAAMYAVALARGHVFNDANKRTALVTALTYLSLEGVEIPRNDVLEDIMVDVAEGNLGQQELSDLLYSLSFAQLSTEEVKRMSFDQIGAIDDPLRLAATGTIAPMLIRYVAATEQLQTRFGECSVPELIDAINYAFCRTPWDQMLGQTMVNRVRDAQTDQYLDELQPLIRLVLDNKDRE